MDADAAALTEAEEASHENATQTEKIAIMDGVKRAIPRCESPIEKLLLPWLVAQRYPLFNYEPRVLFPSEGSMLGDLCVAVVPQLPVGRYRADFALASRHGRHLKFLIVECDGKEFHDSVEQVKRDVDRDVYLTSRPEILEVIRFSGTEIYKSPKNCAAHAAHLLYRCWLKGNPQTDHKFSEVA